MADNDSDKKVAKKIAKSQEVKPSSTFWLMCKQQPLLPIGAAGALASIAYGFYGFKKRGAGMSTGMYLMSYRVYAQGFFVGMLCFSILGATLKSKFSSSGNEK